MPAVGEGGVSKGCVEGGKGGEGDETNLPVSSNSCFHFSFMSKSKRVMLSR